VVNGIGARPARPVEFQRLHRTTETNACTCSTDALLQRCRPPPAQPTNLTQSQSPLPALSNSPLTSHCHSRDEEVPIPTPTAAIFMTILANAMLVE
jgi:hypothetical protein